MRVVAQVAGSCTQACKDICQLPSGELIFAFTLSCHNVSTLGHLARLEGCGNWRMRRASRHDYVVLGFRTLPGLKHMEP
jgi:hypothetical protein